MAHDLKHHHLSWHIENVYLWGEVLKTVVNGPNISWEGLGSPWMLKLGQSLNPQSNGIVLFIRRLGRFKNVAANVRVAVQKDNLNPLLFKNFRVTFTIADTWESPVLCNNLVFKRETSSPVMSRSWEIKVQLMWQEILDYPLNTDIFLRQEKVGADLKAFINNDKYSDIFIRYRYDGEVEGYVPAHKAILAARSPYLCRSINSFPGEDWMDIDEDFFPTQSSRAIDTLLKYFYTGNVKYVAENNPIPLDVFDCAQKMEIQQLEIYTQPYYFRAQTLIKTETVMYEWVIRAFDFMRRTQEPVIIQSNSFGSPNKEQFVIDHTIIPPKNNSPGRIDVFLRFETENGRSICVIADFTVKTCEGNTILRKISPNHNMAPEDSLLCISIKEITEEYMKANPKYENLIFSCKIEYSKNETETVITGPISKSVNQSDSDINPTRRHYEEVYHRWITDFVSDLRMLLLNGIHSDCTIVVGNDRLPAHRVILEARSPYFFNYVHDAGNVRLVHHPMEYHVERDINISTLVMKIILIEIYTGSALITEELSPQEIHAAAITFGLDALAALAKDHLRIL